MYPRNGRWDLGISVVIFFIMTPVPFTRTLCVLAACTFVRRFIWKAFPYLPEWTNILREITQPICVRVWFPLFLPQISCRERLLRLGMKIYKPCSCRHQDPARKYGKLCVGGWAQGLCLEQGVGDLGRRQMQAACPLCVGPGLEDPALSSGLLTS